MTKKRITPNEIAGKFNVAEAALHAASRPLFFDDADKAPKNMISHINALIVFLTKLSQDIERFDKQERGAL